jgi:hypothetical protein
MQASELSISDQKRYHRLKRNKLTKHARRNDPVFKVFILYHSRMLRYLTELEEWNAAREKPLPPYKPVEPDAEYPLKD